MSSIQIKKTGITNLPTDAIVNAANEGLWEGGGVRCNFCRSRFQRINCSLQINRSLRHRKCGDHTGLSSESKIHYSCSGTKVDEPEITEIDVTL